MKTLRSLGVFWLLTCVLPLAWAVESTFELEKFRGDPTDLPSLQRGAQIYMNYCLGCHSLQYQRYQRTSEDLGIPESLFAEHLITTGARIGDHIISAMDPEIAKNWFGVAPPDITMVTRVRSPDWVYTYLKTFYRDNSRPFGVNNRTFPNVGMPHALLDLQGIPTLGCRQVPKFAANGGEARDPLVPGKRLTETQCGQIIVEEGTGQLTSEEYDLAVTDLVNFLDYVGEPSRQTRKRTGIFVLLYLIIFFAFAWLLNREYWRGIR